MRLDELADELADELITASRTFVGIAVRSLAAAPVDLTVPQHRALVLVASGRVTSIGDLADELGVNQSNASRLVGRLARTGLLARHRSAADARTVVLKVTAEGRRTLEAVAQCRRSQVVAILEAADLGGARADVDLAATSRVVAAFNAAAHELPSAHWPDG